MARDDFTIEKFMSARKAELLNYTGKAIEGGRIERRGSLRRLNDDNLQALLDYSDEDLEKLFTENNNVSEAAFNRRNIEYEQSVRENFLKVASDLSNPSLSHENEKGGNDPSYGTEPATAKDIAVFRALCSTLAEFTRDVSPQKFPAVLGLARLKDSKDYGVGFSGKNTDEWFASKNEKPTLNDFSVPPCYSAFYSAVTCALKEMLDITLPDIGVKDTKLFLADPRLLWGDGNLCGACRAVLSARLQDNLTETIKIFEGRQYQGDKYLTVTRDKVYSKAMVLETTSSFYTSYLVENPIVSKVDRYYTNIDGIIEKNPEKIPKRRNSGASLNICKGERVGNDTRLEVA